MFCMQEKKPTRVSKWPQKMHFWENYKHFWSLYCSIYSSLPVPHTDFCSASIFSCYLLIYSFLAHNSWQNTMWSVAWRQDFGRIFHEPPKKKVQKRTSGEWWRPSSPWPNKRSVGKPLCVTGQEEQGLCSRDFCFVSVPGCVLHFIFVLKRKYFKRDRELYFEHVSVHIFYISVANFFFCFSILRNV